MRHDSTFGERRQAAWLRRLAMNRQTQGQLLRLTYGDPQEFYWRTEHAVCFCSAEFERTEMEAAAVAAD
jgi:anti-sigma factor RsiW